MHIFPTPILQTPRLILREVCASDWQQILHLRSDPQVNALVNRPLSKTKEDAIAFIKKVDGNNKAEKIIYWGIVLPETNKVLGSICLWNFSEDRKTAEVGYDLSVAAQGKGYMTEAMQAILDFGFTKLGLTTVEAFTQSNNAASTKLLGKFGFDLLADRKDETNKLNAVYALNPVNIDV
ncbi:MAG: GNAT family N-acetyltransferase [Alcanivoracaceae bacterium]|nr:GNAT family N-acetyltransferase [Alcanivoracaceae bacterium]